MSGGKQIQLNIRVHTYTHKYTRPHQTHTTRAHAPAVKRSTMVRQESQLHAQVTVCACMCECVCVGSGIAIVIMIVTAACVHVYGAIVLRFVGIGSDGTSGCGGWGRVGGSGGVRADGATC